MICRARREDIRLHNRNLRVEPADSWHQPESMENQYYSRDWQRSDRKQSSERCNQDYVQSDICTGTSIQTLNDDCLIHIFLQLPIIDRISIERGKHLFIILFHAQSSFGINLFFDDYSMQTMESSEPRILVQRKEIGFIGQRRDQYKYPSQSVTAVRSIFNRYKLVPSSLSAKSKHADHNWEIVP